VTACEREGSLEVNIKICAKKALFIDLSRYFDKNKCEWFNKIKSV
jgi:hypothetical protein